MKLMKLLILAGVITSGSTVTSAPAQATHVVPFVFPTIQSAIAAAGPGDTVLVNPGSYAESLNFLGKAITVQSSGGRESTLITGEPTTPNGPALVSFTNGEGPATRLQGFRIEGGGPIFGIGIECIGSSPHIVDCSISVMASDDARGITAYNSGPRIQDCLIRDNIGNPAGFGAEIIGGPPARIENCRFINDWGDYGGGIFVNGNDIMISGSIVDACGSSSGGGIVLINSSGSVSGTEVRNCVPFGVTLRGGNPRLLNCIIAGNIGGALPGGGLYIEQSNPRIINCTIAHNDSGYTNAAPGFGGIVLLNANPSITNAIIWGNIPDQITNLGGSSPSISFCNFQGGWPGPGNVSTDPGFRGAAQGDYHLAATSACIDGGTNNVVGLPSIDIDLDPRILYARVDLGADEWQPELSAHLELSQPFGPGTFRSYVVTDQPGSIYVTVLADDPINSASANPSGPWGGLHVDLMSLILQASVGQPPFMGFLDATGQALFESAITVPPALYGHTFYGLTHILDPMTWIPMAVSNLADLELY